MALARALYSDRPVLILDEPTASLDPDAAELFWKTVRSVSEDKIIIIVTHNMEITA
ncbi:MAG TPA: AAA family ATPase [Candidatus Eisenbergiella stercoravium]|nr:AAA family ATPase [Candidatus Eisenbergiella stercoravium]